MESERFYAEFATLKDEFQKMKTMTAAAFSLLKVGGGGRARPRAKQRATDQQQRASSDAAAGFETVLHCIMEALNVFENHLLRFSAKFKTFDSGSEEPIPDSRQAAPNPANENTAPVSHPASDPTAAKTGRTLAPSLVNPDTAGLGSTQACPEDRDAADEPQTASPQTTEQSETSDVDDVSQDTASSDPPSPLPSVDGNAADVEEQTASSEMGKPVADAATTRDVFSLDLVDLRENFIPTLGKYIGDPQFASKISSQLSIKLQSHWQGVVKAIKPTEDSILAVRHARGAGEGVSNLWNCKVPTTEVELPNPTEHIENPTDAGVDLEQYLERLIRAPPEEAIHYFIGGLPPSDLDGLLPSGSELSQLGRIPGVNTLYGHVGEKDSGTALHCEDSYLRSFNICLRGFKLWVMMKMEDTTKVEELNKRLGNKRRCDQSVRHAALLISPTRLRQERIGFDLILAGPGDIVVTGPRQYHYVINVTPSVAVAANFVLPGEVPVRTVTLFCPDDGLFPLMARREEKQKKGHRKRTLPMDASATEQMDRPPKRRPTAAPTTATLKRPAREARTRAADRPSSEAVLAEALCSEEAVTQFQSLVKCRRSPDNMFRLQTNHNTIIQLFQIADQKTLFGEFFTRFCQYRLAKQVDGKKDGSIRTVGIRRQYARELGWSISKFDHHINMGRKWVRLCGPFDGLLCFFLLRSHQGVDYQQYKELLARVWTEEAKDAQHRLHQLLETDDCARLCQAGKAFQDSLQGKDVEFGWESSRKDLAKLPKDQKLTFLQPRPLAAENIYDPSEYPGWPRPAGWPDEWQWPANPTLEGAEGCHECGEVGCDCIVQLPGIGTRIKDYGEKGLGLQAVASTHGQIAYRKGTAIGYLFGKIVPAGTAGDCWALDFVRPDIGGEPVVCQLDCRDTSNIFRLLNHDCKPSACFKFKIASGRWVVAVEARTDIMDGAEITVSYGQKHFGDLCLCVTCQRA
jgi:hypothetical protein